MNGNAGGGVVDINSKQLASLVGELARQSVVVRQPKATELPMMLPPDYMPRLNSSMLQYTLSFVGYAFLTSPPETVKKFRAATEAPIDQWTKEQRELACALFRLMFREQHTHHTQQIESASFDVPGLLDAKKSDSKFVGTISNSAIFFEVKQLHPRGGTDSFNNGWLIRYDCNSNWVLQIDKLCQSHAPGALDQLLRAADNDIKAAIACCNSESLKPRRLFMYSLIEKWFPIVRSLPDVQ